MIKNNAIQLTHNADEILHSFNRLLSSSNDLAPAMLAVEAILANATERSFAEQATPQGEAWSDLSDMTKAQRQASGYWPGQILQRTGHLASSIETDSTALTAEIGTNVIYAALQFYGGQTSPNSMIPNKEIAPREFLGVGADDENAILLVVQKFLADAVV